MALSCRQMGFSLTQQLVEKFIYCCRIFAGCNVMTKRPCCYTVGSDPLFRDQLTQTRLILLVDSHLMTVAANNYLFVLHFFMLIQTLLVQLMAQIFLYNGFLNALTFLMLSPLTSIIKCIFGRRPTNSVIGRLQHSSLNLHTTFLFSMLWFG